MEVNPTNANQRIAYDMALMICVIPWYTQPQDRQHQDRPEL